ncbi:hypothetical protein BH23GEM6_BH23GEM6_25680 [soil metagenome]
MDNLCHTLAGAALGEAGLKRLSGLSMATLMIGANLPDVDAVTLITGSSIALRRGWTHGLLAVAILPPLLLLAMLGWDRWVRRRGGRVPAQRVRPLQLLILAYIGVLSHPFLDWLNSYGVRLLMPFDRSWFYGDALFIIDPWMWMMLGIGALMARRLADSHPARIGMWAVAFYLVVMVGSAVGGRALVHRALLAQGLVESPSIMAGPVPINPFQREVVVSDGQTYRFGTITWRPMPDLRMESHILERNDDHPLARAAAHNPAARDFLVWSRFPFFTIEEDGTGTRVILDDARYSTGRRRSFAAVVVEM